MVSQIFTYKFDAENTPDASKHIPDLFEGPRGWKISVRDPEPKNRL